MRGRAVREVMPTLACAVLIALTLIGCTDGPNVQASTTPTACGSVSHGLGGGSLAGSATPSTQGAETCFWQAYQAHHPASLTYTVFSTDTGTIYTFTLHACDNAACTLSDAHESYRVPGSPRQVGTYDCSALARDATGALIAEHCGPDGNITIPAA